MNKIFTPTGKYLNKYPIFTYLLSLFLIPACTVTNGQSPLLAANISFGQSTVEKIIFDTNENFKGDSINNSINKAFNNRVSLRQINNARPKIEIRVYKLSSLIGTTSLRRVFLEGKTWKAEEIDEWNHPSVIKRYRLSVPQTLDSLILQLLANNILTLPTQASLESSMKKPTREADEGYPVYSEMRVNEGNVYCVEIKIGNKFRTYEFENPEKYSMFYGNKIIEFKKYLNIVRIFDSFTN